MLIRFAVENYNSFKNQEVFSMVAGKQTRHPSHCLNINGRRLLKSSFFFGANASGKSNFVRALDFMRKTVLQGIDSLQYYDRCFRIEEIYKEKPGVFQIDFIQQGKVYSYGFAFNYSEYEFEAEWLYRIESQDKEVCIFERSIHQKLKTDLNLDKEDRLRLDIYANDLNLNELLLKQIGAKNINSDSKLYDFVAAFEWFKKILIIYPESHPKNLNASFLNPAADSNKLKVLLKDFDTGIEGIKKAKLKAEKALEFLPSELLNEVLSNIEKKMKAEDGCKRCTLNIGGKQFVVFLENDIMMAEKIMLDHGNPSDLFELIDESDGTKRLFDLLPLYEIGQKEKIIIIDELDRSFHSKLTQEYIKRFFQITENKYSQLICTTHDLNIMDLKLLRQDEIWFVERGKDHSSKIYSLSDYKERFDKNVLNDYLIGRYGGVPCLTNTDLQED